MKLKVEYGKKIEDVLSELKIDSIKPGDVRVYSSLEGFRKGLPKGIEAAVAEEFHTYYDDSLQITGFGIRAHLGYGPVTGLPKFEYIGRATVIRE